MVAGFGSFLRFYGWISVQELPAGSAAPAGFLTLDGTACDFGSGGPDPRRLPHSGAGRDAGRSYDFLAAQDPGGDLELYRTRLTELCEETSRASEEIEGRRP